MSLPTRNDVQPTDPVLTNLLIGYYQREDRFVASRAFPVVPVVNDNGKFNIWTKKYWFLDSLKRRAPGGEFTQIDAAVSTGTYATAQYAGSSKVEDETQANSQLPGPSLIQSKVNLLGQASLVRKERAFATDFVKTSIWNGGSDGSVTAKFSAHGTSDPWQDIADTALRTVSNNTGVEPNTAVMGYIVHNRLCNHPDMIDRLKYTNAIKGGLMNDAMAEMFGLEQWLVSRASYNSANEAQTFSGSAIIDDDLLLIYVNKGAGLHEPTAGKTFSWAGGGGMGSIYYVRDDLHHTDVVQIKEQWDQQSTALDVGYIFLDCTD